MKFGISTFVNDDSIDTVSLARAIEERGFESLVIAEHTHIPASRESAYPLGGELPKIYYRTLDPFVTLAAAAAVTSTIELFTGIALLIQRDPIITAKEAASIDLISGGRFVFGVGAGWNLEEMRDHGTDPKTRGALLDERIEAIKALWTDEPAEYHGKYVDFPPSYIRPKPVRRPHPPIYIGGNSNATMKRVVRHEAGWISNPFPIEEVTRRVEQLRGAAAYDVPLVMFGTPNNLEYWRAAEDLGFGQLALLLPTKPRDESLRLLDDYAARVAQYRG
ncbi:LLM class F420-dependent oxidoreductase [Mycobacterium paragordonae]|uniref:LLM class F420-dependent oxidoreductase n=1 Tax=Mycobacterium paragordonae TaxID=1389713 RepID=A0A4R5WX18_9MYCO|nr:LLM class F420-dependent oxidoreductase [Mycobacterium paragordonae]MDP7734049.1 LLM class F420-dependent oxidoreductase [Mycobacterium paragordonae]TDK97335.1 LLM class F420-dependent oxidoreductase [Mycobacterium paragordonae]TDL11046.1 LLM class F420-dependent oxidoreductase [Mycobacterium paragordonae]